MLQIHVTKFLNVLRFYHVFNVFVDLYVLVFYAAYFQERSSKASIQICKMFNFIVMKMLKY